jgi:hypothetical protein
LIVRFGDKECMDQCRSVIVRSFTHDMAIVRNGTDFQFPAKGSCLPEWAAANDLWKLSPALMQAYADLKQDDGRLGQFNLMAEDIDKLTTKILFDNLPVEFISLYREGNAVRIRCKEKFLYKQLLRYPELLFADSYLAPQADILVSGFYRNINNLNGLERYLPGANGRGVVIGIKEKMPDVQDIDLYKRVLPSELADPAADNHATTVSTLVGGAGNSFITGKGMAWKSTFFPSSFSNLYPDATEVLLRNKVTVQNHAYGTVIQPFYGAEAVGYDLQSFRQPGLLHVFSSGNRGSAAAVTGTYANLPGFGNLTGNFKMAKNVLTVAALDTGGRVAVFSSAGPLYDGRLGPQLSALGPTGTSEAAALVSGSVAVLQQLYRDSFNQAAAPASLIRALLFNGADDIGAPGIDFRTGFGSLNPYRSAMLLQHLQFNGGQLGPAESWSSTLEVPVQTARLKVTLCWTDTPALANSGRALVNDLDLELVHVNSGTVYRPWCLNIAPSADSLRLLPVRRRDSLNNAEQVSIELPEAGSYRIQVRAHEMGTADAQSFHLAWSIDTLNTFRFTNPVAPEDVITDERPLLRIGWESFPAGADTTGNLSVSYNSGIDWRAIARDISLNRRYFFWSLPDTVCTVQWRMQSAFGTYYTERFVLAPITRIRVDFLCTDSLRLSWQQLPAASAYRVYARGDSAYLGEYATVTDTFLVVRRNAQTSLTYAVQPIHTDGMVAPRSYAVNVADQGVDCYYQALVAEPDDERVKLTLALSYFTGIDSMVFYSVSGSGDLLQRLEAQLPGSSLEGYVAYDNRPNSGTNYYRALIYVRGGIVKTEIVAILHKGAKPVLVYPNPVNRGQQLNILVTESAADGILQIYDAVGRLLGSYPFNVTAGINTAGFAPGLYFYRLTGTEGRNIASGKIIIQ